MARLQGRPDLVMPLHVVAGLRESERGMRDSGVRPVNAIRVLVFRGRAERTPGWGVASGYMNALCV